MGPLKRAPYMTATQAQTLWPDAWSTEDGTIMVPTAHPNIPVSYISPSSLSLWLSDRSEWAIRYLTRRDREPQTPAMVIGAWFDTLVKEKLVADLSLGIDCAFLYTSIECKDARAEALGRECFDHYVKSGAYASLISMVGTDVVVEDDCYGRINGVPFRGKPDLYFKTKSGHPLILDWKVNGIWGRQQSPIPGYVDSFPQRESHKNAVPMLWEGIIVDRDTTSKRPHKWQLSSYNMLLGGDGTGIQVIDQITQSKTKGLRTCRTSYVVDDCSDFIDALTGMWEAITNGCVFTDDPDDFERQKTLRGPTRAALH